MRILLLMACCVALAGCGFHLRGKVGLLPAMQTTYIAAPDRAGDLVRELERLLRANEVNLVDDAAAAGAVLELTSERMERIVQSVGARARVREFALEYDVSFRVVRPDGEVLVPVQALQMVRDYTFDQDQVLGTTAEEELIKRDLRRAMAARIVATLGNP